MRPEVLFPIFADIGTLPGVGARNKSKLQKLLGGDRLIDVLRHVPSHVIDRRHMPTVPEVQHGQVVTMILEVDQHFPPHRGSRTPYKVRCRHETGFVTLVFFHAYPRTIEKQLPYGSKRLVSGQAEIFAGEIQIAHPDYILGPEAQEEVAVLEAVYPLTAGVTQKLVRKLCRVILNRVPSLPEWCTTKQLTDHGWVSWKDALLALHQPESVEQLELEHPLRQRLAYDEMLAHQLALKLTRHFVEKSKGMAIKGTGLLQSKLKQCLPFSLTAGQEQVLAEIFADQAEPHRMMRLLQGDVGSGKTVLALFAMLRAVEEGKQAALMAPTEILAKQHYAYIADLCEQLGLKAALLTAAIKGKKRKELLAALEAGEIDCIIGTHALFSEKVVFANLAMVVIDEQHRFGVKQRLALSDKGMQADILLMTATPIPRTLTLTLYGDMECSNLTEKPQGRKPIDTRIIPLGREQEVMAGLSRVMERKEQVYWICPLIEESELVDLAAANARYEALKKIYGNQVGLVHGQMKQEEREKVMQQFQQGELQILVATTVVEVGVNVPNATVIVIEHAERFGLAQLHQLRGRVGRSDQASSCILLYQALSPTAKRRLEMMRQTNDGFRLAEEDLRLRGGGDVLGTKQSGLPAFYFADFSAHFDLLKRASEDAMEIITNDPHLQTSRGEALRVLLYLFDYDAQMRYLQVG